MNKADLPRYAIRLSGGLDARACVELARAVEDGGFASIWFAENPFQRGVMATAGACAAATRRVEIGVGVVNPYGRHPATIAMEFAALDELSRGRAVLGIGSGVAASVRRMGFSDERPVSAVREAIAIIRTMLAGGSVTMGGRVFRVDDARLNFTPLRPDMPIYMAAAGERALQACGELADGLIISNLTPPRTTERLVAAVREAAKRAGRPCPRIVQYVPCAARLDPDAARRAVKVTLGEMLTSFWPPGDRWPPAKERIVVESGIPRDEFAVTLARLRRGEEATAVLDARFVAAFAIAGDAEGCRRQAELYRTAGVDELALTFAGLRAADDIAYLGRRFS